MTSTFLRKIPALHAAISDLHPLLERLYPIGIINEERLLVFDVDPGRRSYRLVRNSVIPGPVFEQTCTTVPLPDYGNRPVCVVSCDTLDSVSGCIAVFHEFAHCAQWEICEPELAAALAIAYKGVGRVSVWEARHPLPYDNDRLAYSYRRMLAALEAGDLVSAWSWHSDAVQNLTPLDREFIVWNEWKEGFARWVEDRIRRRLGVRRNENGRLGPFGRETLHVGGSELIRLMIRTEPPVAHQLRELYRRIREALGAQTSCDPHAVAPEPRSTATADV